MAGLTIGQTLSAELVLSSIDSFYVGGSRRKIVDHQLGPSESVVGAMYVQRLVPANRTLPLPLVFIHGGVHCGVTWETTPDGREGWQTLFTRWGAETLVVDQAHRGRSAPNLLSQSYNIESYEGDATGPAFTVGAKHAEGWPRGGNRFPMSSLTQYLSQLLPDFYRYQSNEVLGKPGCADPATVDALVALLDRIGPAVLVTHSQGGHAGWRTAIERPDKVVAIVAVEPGRTTPGLDDSSFPDIPVMIMWGDNLPEEWVSLSMDDVRTGRDIAKVRPKVLVDLLPEAGIYGNGHMLMLEDNNEELARRAFDWLSSVLT
jgi:pimeloyl-ACP methyl ester carboxylesterase